MMQDGRGTLGGIRALHDKRLTGSEIYGPVHADILDITIFGQELFELLGVHCELQIIRGQK